MNLKTLSYTVSKGGLKCTPKAMGHMCVEYNEYKEDEREVTVDSISHETPMNATAWEDINFLLADGYEVDYYRLLYPEKKPSARGDTDQPVYKYIYDCNDIDHSN